MFYARKHGILQHMVDFMHSDPHKETCDLCKRKFAFTNGYYGGRMIPRFKIILCNHCYSGCRDGVPPAHEGTSPEVRLHIFFVGLREPEQLGATMAEPVYAIVECREALNRMSLDRFNNGRPCLFVIRHEPAVQGQVPCGDTSEQLFQSDVKASERLHGIQAEVFCIPYI